MPKIATAWIAVLKASFVATIATLGAAPALAAEEDPWEGVNRAVFRFNDTVDTYTLKPLAKGYQKVTPEFVEDGIGNVFSNLGDVIVLTNDLLQGKVRDAGIDTSRILFNTTFGVLGFFDVATRMGLHKNDEDFGQTLGAWGVDSGPYVVLPLLGPSTVRDAIGRVPDAFLEPYPHMSHVPTRNVTRGVDLVDLTDEELAGVHEALTPEVREVLTIDGAVASRSTRGGTARPRVEEQRQRVVDAARDHRQWAQAPVRDF